MSHSVRATWIQGTWKSARREATPLSAHNPNSQVSGFCLSAALLTIGSSPHDRNTDGHPEWLMCPPDLVEGNAENGSRYELVSLCSAPSKAHMEKIGGGGNPALSLAGKSDCNLPFFLKIRLSTGSCTSFLPDISWLFLPSLPPLFLSSFVPSPLPCFVRWCVLHFCSFSQALFNSGTSGCKTRQTEFALQSEGQKEMCIALKGRGGTPLGGEARRIWTHPPLPNQVGCSYKRCS